MRTMSDQQIDTGDHVHHGGRMIPRVVSLEQTCDACPSQWQGRTDTGEFVYIRYRWGNLECGIADTERDAVLERETIATLGDGLDGYIDEAQMMEALAKVLRFDGVA